MHTSKLALLLPTALIAIALAMYAVVANQRQTATQAAARTEAAVQILTGMLDQETGLRGFVLTGREDFLQPFHTGRQEEARGNAAIRRQAEGDRRTLELLALHEQLSRQWRAKAHVSIQAVRVDRRDTPTVADALARKRLMDRIRADNQQLRARLAERRSDDLRTAGIRATLFILAIVAVLGTVSGLVVRSTVRRRRAIDKTEIAYRRTQREFTDVIQVVQSEPEAHALLKRHLELRLPGAEATVLNRNNSDNRLEPTTGVTAGTPLAEHLADAEPTSCQAVRLGRRHESTPGDDALVTCAICGDAAGPTACQPLLVGGQVIGSVLVERDVALDGEAERRLTESVSQAAPVLANLRNLALAERRASTDVLTGLPNRRAVQDTLKRMAAQASRQVQPLAAIAIDLDRFKDINDRFGHEMGDTVLATVASLLQGSIRTSDFVGRQGGEEFLVLAPDTGVPGATILAENLRAAFEREAIPGLDRDVTGSFGVAVLPDHAGDPDALLRLADRALYAAKSAGRNRVEVALVGDAAPAPSA